MKILHTSDWHLGRTLHKVDLHEHQAVFLDWLVDLVEAEQVDVVVIPGDVYDRAVPAVSSVTLLDRALARLQGNPHRPASIRRLNLLGPTAPNRRPMPRNRRPAAGTSGDPRPSDFRSTAP